MNFEPGWLLRQLAGASKQVLYNNIVDNLEVRGDKMSKVDELKTEIKKCMDQIDEIQNECSHPKACVTSKHGANTGNWDPSDDCYWADLHCSLCDKRWHVDSDHEHYRKY